MAWRNILVHLDSDPRRDARIDVALRLAHERGARLIGVAATGWVDWRVPVLPPPLGVGQFAAAVDELRVRAETAARHFSRRCEAASLREPHAALVDEGDAANVIVEQGHCSDLIVIGQPDPAQPGHRAAQDVAERVVLYASRPVLVLPCAGRVDALGTQILVAWDGGREAARALADALPVLHSATAVQLVNFAEPGADPTPGQRTLHAAARWLLSHGVKADVRSLTRADSAVGDALLSHAADSGADLIVMGAYGHARWSERVLGGATRSLLQQMTVPVLMSR